MTISRGDKWSDPARTFRQLARRCLLSPTRASRSDAQLGARGHGNPAIRETAARPDARATKDAAVLVPIVDRSGELNVLLTRRADHLANHAGQIAFPGGKVEEWDACASATALRETHEEIGLEARYIEIIGMLDIYHTGTGFRVYPAVSLVEPSFTTRLDRNEVSDIFEVPLAFLMDPANHQRHSLEHQGRARTFYAIPYGSRYIWGATAGMLRNLYERLYG